VLEYVSGAPVKARIVDRIPNIFDYDELTRYGYSVRIHSSPVVVWDRVILVDVSIDRSIQSLH
jgi:hypothetical protein